MGRGIDLFRSRHSSSFGADVGEMEDLHDARRSHLGDSVTTDHISPAGAIKASSPAGIYYAERGVAIGDFNSSARAAAIIK